MLFLGEENKNKTLIITTILKNLELSNRLIEMQSTPFEQTFNEPQKTVKKNHL